MFQGLTKKPRFDVNEGRPFLVEGVARLAAVGPGAGWGHLVDGGVTPTPAQRKALIEHFTMWGLAEHASIASFARFTLQLLALGAPSGLVSRSIAAMADEVRHARFGFGLVEALSGANSPNDLTPA